MTQKIKFLSILIYLTLALSFPFVSEAQRALEPSIKPTFLSAEIQENALLDITIDGKIRSVLVDSSGNCVYLNTQTLKGNKLKPEGRAIAVDLTSGKVLWKTERDKIYTKGIPRMGLSEEGNLFFVTKYGAWGLNKSNGQVVWSIDSNDFVAHPNGSVILSNETENYMALWDTETGELIWEYNYEFSNTDNIRFSSDSCMVVIEKGVHHVSLSDGSMWHRKINGLLSYDPVGQGGSSGVVGASTVMFGLLGGLIAAAATSNNGSGVGNKTSNYLLEEDAIYVAAKELAKYDHLDSELWITKDLSKKRSVSSIISLNETDLILVNYGYRYNIEGMKVRSGDAFCEFYSKESGELLRSITLETTGDDFIKDFVLNSNTISFLSKRSLFTISLETLETIRSKEFGGAYANIGLSKFADPNDYQLEKDRFVQMRKKDDNLLYIYNTGNKIVEFDEHLELTRVFSANSFYEHSDEANGLILIKNGEETLAIDKDGNRTSTTALSSNACFKKGYLVDYKDDRASIVKL